MVRPTVGQMRKESRRALEDFYAYAKARPKVPFWTALRDWSGKRRILWELQSGVRVDSEGAYGQNC